MSHTTNLANVDFSTDAIYRLSVEKYHRLIAAQIFEPDDRVELLEGLVVAKYKQSPPQAATIMYVHHRLSQNIGTVWLIRIRSAITTDDSEPEPELAVVAGPANTYLRRHPGPTDIAVLIEIVDDRSYELNRNWKGRIYARARIPCFWIIHLNEHRIEVYSNPKGRTSPAYRERMICRPGEKAALVLRNRLITTIPVNDLRPS